MKTNLLLVFAAIASLITGCTTHTVRVKGAHFVAPVTASRQWGGYASGSLSNDTRITLTENTDGNPPKREVVRINEDIDMGDLFGVNMIGLEAGISPFESGEVYLDNALLGLRWQFLNHGAEEDEWVAAVQGGFASSSSEGWRTESSTTKVSAQTSRVQAGISAGYKVNRNFLPYLSFLHERYTVKSDITNSNGSFGPYTDKGRHNYVALGMMRPGPGFLWAVEYNLIMIDWDRAVKDTTQGSLGLRFGGSW